jgi:hypothetical protein
MNLYPYLDFNIISPLQPSEVEACLYNLVTPNFINVQKIKYPDYEGFVTNGKFELKTRTVGKQSPFLYLKGHILTQQKGCRLIVKVCPTVNSFIPVLVFMLLEAILIYTLLLGDGNTSPFWVPLVVGLFGYFLLVVFVRYETGAYRRILLKALNGKFSLKGDKF